MIFLFILHSLFMHDNVVAGPLQPLHPTFENLFYPHELGSNRFTQRSTWNIVWSCLTTVFACSWVAVHPNIPAPSSRMFLTRLKIMGCMLIAPELVIVWAARQCSAAHDIAGRHKDRQWTITHGFFASMGGFMLYDNGVMTKTLGILELEQLESEKKIDWPSISQEDIRDKSKGDWVSKGFAMLQTSWFIVQCIARAVAGLNITQIELATLAFAILNIILSVLWWDKPLGVSRPVPVHLCHFAISDPTTAHVGPPPGSASLQYSSAFIRLRAYFSQNFEDMGPVVLIYGFIAKPVSIVWSSMGDMLACDSIPDNPTQFCVPTFYAPGSSKEVFAMLIGLGVGILFGGIHCIAWAFGFLSIPEEYVWKSSAVAITVVPIIICLQPVLAHILPTNSCFEGVFKSLSDFMTSFSIAAYCASRAALLILPLLDLRSLSPSSLLDFEWTSFIPHI